MAIYDFFVSRNNSANLETYTGHVGRLFYDDSTGIIKLSDGVTPGGVSVPYTIATADTVGGIKAGPGANVSVDGVLTIDTTGLPLAIGNIQIIDTTISAVNADADVILQANGTGNVELVGNVEFHTTSDPNSRAFFRADNQGRITTLVPIADTLTGAFRIVGSDTGNVSVPINTGVMLHVTGHQDDVSRIYNDSIGNFSTYAGRRINGNVANPMPMLAGQDIMRLSAAGYTSDGMPQFGSSRITFRATENYTGTAQGGRLIFSTTPIGSNVLVEIGSIDNESGLVITKANVVGNLNVSNITTTGTISLGPGSPGRPPLKFTSGALSPTPTVGAMNFEGNVFTGTPLAGQRGVIPTEQIFVLGSNLALGGNTALQSLLGVGPMVSSNTRYWYQIMATVNKTSGTSATLSYAIGGNAVLSKHSFTVYSASGTDISVPTSPLGMFKQLTSAFDTGTVITGQMSNTVGSAQVFIYGIVEVTTGGTLHPLISFSAAPGGASTQALSKMCIWPMGSSLGGNISIGTWR